MTQEFLRPLVDSELDTVAGGMTAVFQTGAFKMVVWATPGFVQVSTTNGGAHHTQGSGTGGSCPDLP